MCHMSQWKVIYNSDHTASTIVAKSVYSSQVSLPSQLRSLKLLMILALNFQKILLPNLTLQLSTILRMERKQASLIVAIKKPCLPQLCSFLSSEGMTPEWVHGGDSGGWVLEVHGRSKLNYSWLYPHHPILVQLSLLFLPEMEPNL